MPREQNTAQPPAIPSVSLPADVLATDWRVVRRDSQGNAESTLYSFTEKKSQAEVLEWAARKFSDCEICAVFPKEFESRAFAVLHSYRQGLPVSVDRLSLDCPAAETYALLKAKQAFPEDNNFTVYPINP